MKKESFKKHTIISTKIIQKVTKIYILFFAALLLVFSCLIIPAAYRSSDLYLRNSISLMNESLTNSMNYLVKCSQTLEGLNSLTTTMKNFTADPTISNKASVTLELNSYIDTASDLLAVTLEDTDGNYFQSNRFEQYISQESTKTDSNYQRILSGDTYSVFSAGAPFNVTTNDNTIYYYYPLIFTRQIHINYRMYVLRLYYNSNALRRNLDLEASLKFDHYVIISRNNLLFSSDGNSAFTYDSSKSTQSLDKYITLSGFIYYVKNLSQQCIIYAYISHIHFFFNDLVILGVMIGVYIASYLLIRMLLGQSVDKELLPLGDLHQAMKNYSIGDNPVLKIHSKDEIQDLSDRFNEMVIKINQQYTELQKTEHKNAITNYKLLATQIDPHFIYNTMNLITILARENKTADIEALNSALIRIMRARLSVKLSPYTTVQQELDTLNEYNLIMDYRYKNKIHTQIDVDQTLYSCYIPINILQPLAENSFYHGFADLTEFQKGNIILMIYQIDERIEIEFSDDGKGISAEHLKILNSRSYEIYNDRKPHIGIDNIRQRLSFLYHKDYQFEIHSSPGAGTTVCISLPLMTKPPQEEI